MDDPPKMSARMVELRVGLVGVVGGVARLSPLLMLPERGRGGLLSIPPVVVVEFDNDDDVADGVCRGFLFLWPSSTSPFKADCGACWAFRGDDGGNLPHTLPIVAGFDDAWGRPCGACVCVCWWRSKRSGTSKKEEEKKKKISRSGTHDVVLFPHLINFSIFTVRKTRQQLSPKKIIPPSSLSL